MSRPPKLPRPWPVPRTRSARIDALTAADVPAFWDVLERLPLVEPADEAGDVVVTFCWRDPDAAAVLLFANRLTDETHLADTLLERLDGSDLWHASFRMRADWRASYAFLVARPGERPPWEDPDGHVALRSVLDRGLPDPLNPARCHNRAGVAQSVVSLPEAPPQPWLDRRDDVPHGVVTEVIGPDGRDVLIYDPPGASVDEELPVLVALDGEVWTDQQSLPTTLDNLIADGELDPVRALLPTSGGRDRRWQELSSGGDGVGHLVDVLLPWYAVLRPTVEDPAAVAVAGQSLGGLTALRAGLLRPDRIGTVISHSASLWQDDLAEEVASAQGSSLRVFLSHGAQEWVLAPPHHDLAGRLRAAGLDLTEDVYNGGHDYACWRGGLADAVRRWRARLSD